MDKNDIKRLLQKGERLTLEAKLAKTDVPKSIWESYSAFANTMGGTILLGVFEDMKEKDPAKRFRIEGVDDAEKIRKDFWNTINSNKVSDNILTDSDVEVVDVDGLQVVCIHMPMADWRVKPVYLNENVYKNTFKRNHEGDYHCTEQQVRAMIRDSYEGGNDGALMEHYDMNDVDPDTLRRYRTLFQFRNEGHVWNEVDDKTFLKNLGGYINRQTGRNMVLWNGVCTVHDALEAESILKLKQQNPDAPVIAHPECNSAVLAVSEFIGSTKAMLNYVAKSEHKRFIVATESGILYEMRKNNPDKEFIAVPSGESCACTDCSYMKMNTLEKLYRCLRDEQPEILLDAEMIERARRPIVRMLDMSRELGIIK